MTGIFLIKTVAVVGTAGLGEGVIVGMSVIDPSITNLIGVALGAIVTITMGWFAFRTAMANLNKKVDAQTEKVDQTLRKTDVVLGHVNSEKTEAQGRIALLENEIVLLREMVADKKNTAALLAQAVVASPVAAAQPGAPATLKNIEKHTSDTADNTARTEAKVNEIEEKQ